MCVCDTQGAGNPFPTCQILSGRSFFCQHVWSDARMNRRESWSGGVASSALQWDTHTSRFDLQQLGRTIKIPGNSSLCSPALDRQSRVRLVCPHPPTGTKHWWTGGLVFSTQTHGATYFTLSWLDFPSFPQQCLENEAVR